jgi:hypothetical protein
VLKKPNNLVTSASKEYSSIRIPRNPDPNLTKARTPDEGYSNIPETDSAGRLLFTRDGDPIMPGSLLAGQRSQGGVGKGLHGRDIKAASSTLSRRINRVPRTELGGDSGKLDQLWEYPNRQIKERVEAIKDPIERERQALAHGATNHGWRIRIADDIPSEDVSNVLAHETAHIFDEVAGQIPTKGIKKDLLKIYNDLNNLDLPQGSFQPRTVKFSGKEYKYPGKKKLLPSEIKPYPKKEDPFELWAEAIRAYMVDPNYIKSVAPKVAQRIREYVNKHPELKNIIQFNALAPVGVTGLLAEEHLSQQ